MSSSESNISRQRWARPLASGDAAGAAAPYKAGARMLVANASPFEGREAKGGLKRMIDAGFELMIEHGRYSSEFGGGTDVGEYLVVLERQGDGSLKPAFDVYSSTGPQAGR